MPYIGYGFDYGVFDTLTFDAVPEEAALVAALAGTYSNLSFWYSFNGAYYDDLISVDSITIPTLVQPGSATITVHDGVDWDIFRTPADQEEAFSGEFRLYMGISGILASQVLYTGIVRKAVYHDDTVTLYLVDKLAELLNAHIGTGDHPISKPSNRSVQYAAYKDADWLNFRRRNPLDIIWYILNTYGGLDGLAAPENEEIDYNSWAQAWVDADSFGYSITWNSSGTTIRDALAEIAKYANLFIGIDELGRLFFYILFSFQSEYVELTHSNMLDFSMEVDADSIINKVTVNSRYNWVTARNDSDAVTVGSYNLYGRRDALYDSRSVYHDNNGSDVSATAFANQIIEIISIPNMLIRAQTNAVGFMIRPGRLFTVTESKTELVDVTFVCEQINLDIYNGTTTLVGRKPSAYELAP